MDAKGSSTLNVSAGTYDWINAYDSGAIYLSGGQTNWLTVHNSGTIHMSGGNTDWLVVDGGVATCTVPGCTTTEITLPASYSMEPI